MQSLKPAAQLEALQNGIGDLERENGVVRVPASQVEVSERDKPNLTWCEVWLQHVLEIALA